MNKANRLDQPAPGPTYGDYHHVVDFILGITFEIWEGRAVDRIHDYYAADTIVYSLEGITRGAAQMVTNTHATLDAFPDRLLLGEDVVWDGTLRRGFSSHRILSPMTNAGPTTFGPATGRRVQIMNIADCEITDGRITREWLLRDNLALVMQLGVEPKAAARRLADGFQEDFVAWLDAEYQRVSGQAVAGTTAKDGVRAETEAFAGKVLEALWINGDEDTLQTCYAPYCVLQRAPVRLYSGRPAILDHYAGWRAAFPGASLRVDHVCSQPFTDHGSHVAVRWSMAGVHEGTFCGQQATGKPVYCVGVTHWRVLDGRIINEWTVFDEIGMLAQILPRAA